MILIYVFMIVLCIIGDIIINVFMIVLLCIIDIMIIYIDKSIFNHL